MPSAWMMKAESIGPNSLPPSTERPYTDTFSPRSCKKKMSVIVLGTMDSIGASQAPRNARAVRRRVYDVVLATPSQMHATPMRNVERR